MSREGDLLRCTSLQARKLGETRSDGEALPLRGAGGSAPKNKGQGERVVPVAAAMLPRLDGFAQRIVTEMPRQLCCLGEGLRPNRARPDG